MRRFADIGLAGEVVRWNGQINLRGPPELPVRSPDIRHRFAGRALTTRGL
jgi:hypothetical protein